MRIFMKNTDGQPSASLTMMMITFVIIILWLIFWLIGSTYGLPVPAFDATTAVALLTPLSGLYFGRRFTSKTDATSKVTEVSIDGTPVVTVSTDTETNK